MAIESRIVEIRRAIMRLKGSDEEQILVKKGVLRELDKELSWRDAQIERMHFAHQDKVRKLEEQIEMLQKQCGEWAQIFGSALKKAGADCECPEYETLDIKG